MEAPTEAEAEKISVFGFLYRKPKFCLKRIFFSPKKLFLAGKVLPPIRNVIFTLSNIIDEIPIPWSQFAGMYLSLSVRADVLLCESFSFSKSIKKTRSWFLVLSLVFS